VRILCIAAVAVLLLAACGGGGGGGSSTQLSPAAYRAKLAKVKVDAATAQAHVGRGLQAKTVADLKKTVDRFAADTQRIGDEIAQLNPPQDAAAANTELAQGFQDIAAATRDASAKVAKLKTAQAGISYLRHATGPIQAGHKVDDALAKLKKLGYTTGS
jgi:cytochrome c556